GDIKKRFPGITFQDNVDAVKSVPAPEHASRVFPPLDLALLDDLADCERMTLQMMERMDAEIGFPYAARVRLFHRHLRYWLGILDHYKPLAVILPNSPHLIYDYVLYELCKRKGITTILFTETSVEGYIYPIVKFENCSD